MFSLAEVLPFAPAVEVDEGLHAAPFHHFAGEPFEVHGLYVVSNRRETVIITGNSGIPWSRNRCSPLPELHACRFAASSPSERR